MQSTRIDPNLKSLIVIIGLDDIWDGTHPLAHHFLTTLPTLLPNRLHRLPDGETGSRDHFTAWQRATFSAAPEALLTFSPSTFSFEPPRPLDRPGCPRLRRRWKASRQEGSS